MSLLSALRGEHAFTTAMNSSPKIPAVFLELRIPKKLFFSILSLAVPTTVLALEGWAIKRQQVTPQLKQI